MTREEHLLLKLMEECDELSQRASKAIRFGLDEIQPTNKEAGNNGERLIEEFYDLVAVMDTLTEEGYIQLESHIPLDKILPQRKQRIEKYLKYSEEQGKLKESKKVTELLEVNHLLADRIAELQRRDGMIIITDERTKDDKEDKGPDKNL